MFSGYEVLVAVIDHGSLTAGARHLGRSLQAVSRSLAALEREIGVELVRRTTRSLQPTAAGLALHARVKAALGELEAGRNEATEHATAISGQLRIGASGLFAPVYLIPAVDAFMKRHPGVTIDLHLQEAYVDLVSERLDISIRVGELEDSSLKARRLGSMRRVTFASPSYIGQHGRPGHPDELAGHQCVIRTTAHDAETWTYVCDGLPRPVRVSGRFRASSAPACNEAVVRGMGIGLAPLWQVGPMLDQGRVELVLCDFEPPPTPLSAVWPASAGLPARTRLLIDFLVTRFSSERW